MPTPHKENEEMLKRFDERFSGYSYKRKKDIKLFIQSEIALAVKEERERIVEIIKNSTSLYGVEVVVSEDVHDEKEVRGFERGRDFTKERIINLINK